MCLGWELGWELWERNGYFYTKCTYVWPQRIDTGPRLLWCLATVARHSYVQADEPETPLGFYLRT